MLSVLLHRQLISIAIKKYYIRKIWYKIIFYITWDYEKGFIYKTNNMFIHLCHNNAHNYKLTTYLVNCIQNMIKTSDKQSWAWNSYEFLYSTNKRDIGHSTAY